MAEKAVYSVEGMAKNEGEVGLHTAYFDNIFFNKYTH